MLARDLLSKHASPPPPWTPTASQSSVVVVDVCFLALGPPAQIDYSTSIIRNIEAQAAPTTSVRYHLLVDRPRASLRAQMHQRGAWRAVPKRKIHLHSVRRIPNEARALYRQLSRTATGPGPIYLYKPLLHLVLPQWLTRVIVLDTDLFLFSDIAGLWARFDHFVEGELLGVASEQCPSYQEVRALGGVGVNGGVQLLALEGMRRSEHYAKLLLAYAQRRMPMKPGGIGWLGDQTLYSWMTVNGTGARPIFHLLPCGWNRQIGTHMANWAGFWDRHRCSSRCYLLHGNYVGHKKFMESLKQDPTGRSCGATVNRYRGIFPRGSADARMLDVVARECCQTR